MRKTRLDGRLDLFGTGLSQTPRSASLVGSTIRRNVYPRSIPTSSIPDWFHRERYKARGHKARGRVLPFANTRPRSFSFFECGIGGKGKRPDLTKLPLTPFPSLVSGASGLCEPIIWHCQWKPVRGTRPEFRADFGAILDDEQKQRLAAIRAERKKAGAGEANSTDDAA